MQISQIWIKHYFFLLLGGTQCCRRKIVTRDNWCPALSHHIKKNQHGTCAQQHTFPCIIPNILKSCRIVREYHEDESKLNKPVCSNLPQFPKHCQLYLLRFSPSFCLLPLRTQSSTHHLVPYVVHCNYLLNSTRDIIWPPPRCPAFLLLEGACKNINLVTRSPTPTTPGTSLVL